MAPWAPSGSISGLPLAQDFCLSVRAVRQNRENKNRRCVQKGHSARATSVATRRKATLFAIQSGDMPRLDKLPRAFVSYSRKDIDFTKRLAADLRKRGIELWVDFEGLTPGTPDWEKTIRMQLSDSFALLLVCSPASQASPYVRSELLLAQARRLGVFALWADGDSWIDSVPMNLAHIQYLDFRAGEYSASLDRLVLQLLRLDAAIPAHFIYTSFYTKVNSTSSGSWHERMEAASAQERILYGSSSSSKGSFDIFSKQPPYGMMEIRLDDIFSLLERSDCADTLFVRPSEFKTAAQLLDEIYINYFADTYPPFSYGREWHLRQGFHPVQLGLDWKGLRNTNRESPISHLGILQGTPEKYWFVTGSKWVVSSKMPQYTVVLGSYDKWLIETILTQPKAAHFLVPELMQPASPRDFGTKNLDFVAVAADFAFGPPGGLANKFLIQAVDCTDEIKARWTR